MADIDEFFAKKDKKQKKKFKTTTTNSLAKALESQAQPQENQTDRDVKIDLSVAPTRDDEWREEDDREKDLEGLKVQALKESDEAGGREGEGGIEQSEDANLQKSSSVWQSLQQETAANVPVEVESTPETKYTPPPQRATAEAERPTQTSEKYIPPSVRRAAATTDKYVSLSRKTKNVPPDLQSTQMFPSLQQSVEISQKDRSKDTAGFKEVRSSARGPRAGDGRYEERSGVGLANRFGALERDQNY